MRAGIGYPLFRSHPAVLESSHFSGFDCDLESFESILDFVNLAANSITSRATERIAGTGMMTVAGGFGNGSGFPTGNKVSILTRA